MGKDKMKGKAKVTKQTSKQTKKEIKIMKDSCCSPSGKDNKSGCGCC